MDSGAYPIPIEVSFAFSEPVQIQLDASFASLLRDGQNNGRFERVQLSSAEDVTFASPESRTSRSTLCATRSSSAGSSPDPGRATRRDR